MPLRPVALALVLLMVGSTVAVGAATPTPEPTATPHGDEPLPMGMQITEFMQASAAQATGTVGNGLWVASYARANGSERRTLVEGRVGTLNRSLADLHAERQALQAQYRNGTIDRLTYRARLSALVGQLAALGDGIEDASVRGRAVGVDETQLETLRTQARELGGGEVSRIARNLSGGHDPPGHAGVFGDSRPGRSGDAGPDDRGNGPPDSPGNRGNGGGPPSDRQGGAAGDTTSTPTPTPTESAA